jgi:chromosome segregation ATPase
MAAFRNLLLLSLVMGSTALTQRSGMKQMTNPIRRVVTMMQTLQKKITEEGERDEKLFEAYMCYCKSGTGDLEASIEASTEKIPQVTAALESAKAAVGGLTEELKAHKADRAAAEEALAKAQALREKEAAAFAKASSDMKTNLAAMGKAIAAIEKGSGSFLQTESANVLRKITISMDLSDSDRDMLTSFLTVGSGYAPQSGAIVGILKQMEETMAADLSDVTKAEEEAIANYTALVAAKEKEIAANSKAIEDKTARVGEKGTEIVNLSEDLDDTKTSLAEDTKFLADLKEGCGTKEEEYELVKKTRAEELLALADTIKILNDDDALDLFKKTLPSTSLMQVTVTSKEVRRRALRALHSVKTQDSRLELISLSLHSKKVSFDKVLSMIDEMVVLLGKEQKDDEVKKAYCEDELDKSEDEAKVLDQDISDLSKAIEDGKQTISTLVEEIKALTAGIKALDKSVAEATEQRKEENEEYKSVMASNTAAKELLKIAKNRLNKFYNPKQYQAPAKRELSAEDRIAVNMGGEAPAEEASFVQVRAHSQAADEGAPPPPPEAVGAYKKKGQESSGIITLIDMLEADLDKEMQEMTVEEKDAQKDYEKYVEDSADKRTLDSKSIEEKEGMKADLEARFQKNKLEKKHKLKEAYATATIIKDLHLECDWLISNFEVRKEARAGEVDSLKKAKAVLSGADYSLVQTSNSRLRVRRSMK